MYSGEYCSPEAAGLQEAEMLSSTQSGIAVHGLLSRAAKGSGGIGVGSCFQWFWWATCEDPQPTQSIKRCVQKHALTALLTNLLLYLTLRKSPKISSQALSYHNTIWIATPILRRKKVTIQNQKPFNPPWADGDEVRIFYCYKHRSHTDRPGKPSHRWEHRWASLHQSVCGSHLSFRNSLRNTHYFPV